MKSGPVSIVKRNLGVFFGLGCWFAICLSAWSAEPVKFQSAETQTALLEMFTAEGCSICPSAEAWLSRLVESPRLWKEVVPMAFHVDSLDHPGWKDTFASRSYTKRQDDYAGAWRRDSLRTPDFAWNGTEWLGWYKKEDLPGASAHVVGVLTASSEDQKKWTIQFSPAKAGKESYIAHAALLGFGLRSNAKGKDSSNGATYDFVVLAFAEDSLAKSNLGYRGTIGLKTRTGFSPQRTAIAVWVTPAKQHQPVQALGGWLSAADQ